MKAVILAGGLGTRISEESHLRPKPMIEIGGKPIIWHIMKIYTHFGITDFVVCLGYKGYVIKEYFANYFLHMSDVTFDMAENRMHIHNRHAEPWRVTLVDTGDSTATGGRLKRARDYLDDGTFCLTYGDGVANVDVAGLVEFHRRHGRLATVTAVQPPGRYGALDVDGDERVRGFMEKPLGDGGWINGGFFVLEPGVFDYIQGDATPWEHEPMRRLAREGQLMSFLHRGFWQPMDTLRDRSLLEERWTTGKAEWRLWD
ncbi:glucose-1-phosphate cytidylyltransferase [Pseudoxanthomonas jiangsuensis]|uniref:glucose-1-phosphate cytidylyltransferase n=1 Tax=Pseudoxanthomonas jiangsuensis TaxID=619688 RepID=UPI001B86C695|nr:glucose-1-phosphate cytidylyltransferase [Pseudoxanthomonas jiangsuensis]KAF1694515.1 glucose-1-phosphate cytidylyltransferase [Pseudoxanthomonas jiangsuensis]